MNKLLIFPLAILTVLSVYSMVDTGVTYEGSSDDYSEFSGTNMSGESGSVEIPQAEEQTFDIWSGVYAIALITVAIAIGILAGITVFGSGLGDPAQRLIFVGILFLGTWACLSWISSEYILVNIVGSLFWVILTLIYALGVGIHVSTG